MPLSKRQLDEICDIISRRFSAFTFEAIGKRSLTESEIEELKRLGLLRESVRGLIADPVTIGKVVALIPPLARSEITFDSVLSAAKRMEPMTSVEKLAIEYAENHAGEYIKGIGDMLIRDVRTTAARGSITALRSVQEGVANAVAKRKTLSQLKTDLFDMLDDSSRDWQRVAHTEINNAIQNGVYQEIRAKGGKEQLVFKRPNPDACFVAGTMVETSIGPKDISKVSVGEIVLTHKGRWRKVTHTFRNKYSGLIYGINGAANATSNHPFLVNSNWISADSIKAGDNIVGFIGSNSDNDPSVISEKRFFKRIPISRLRGVMPSASIDLYRNLQFRNSDIDVIFADSVFKNWIKWVKNFCKTNGFFSGTCQVLLSGFCFFALDFIGESECPSGARSFGDRLSIFFGRFFKHFRFNLTCPLEAYPIRYKSSLDDTFADVKISSNTDNAFAFFKVLLDHFTLVDLDDIVFSHVLCLRRVGSIVEERFAGDVFNIEVEEDESYFANGIAVHNCKHCKRLYLQPDGITPKIFKLSELHDSNVGLKAASWLPTIGSIHPWCACQLHVLPEGYGFETKRTVGSAFEHDGKKFKAGEVIEESVYNNLNTENKNKTRTDAVLTYKGEES